MSRPGTPTLKGPPASFMPTPGDVQQMSSTSPAAGPEERITDSSRYITIQSSTDIDWTRPLHEQLQPNLKGGPRKSTSFDDLCMPRSRIPRLFLGQLLKQPLMVVIWCRDLEDASRFQYLMQILQVQLHDYVPKYHIFVDRVETVDKLIQSWQEPTTL